MGLDIVEFVMCVEKAFDLQFPDGDLQNLATPREFIDYIATHLPRADRGGDLEEIALSKLRDAISAELHVATDTLQSRTSLETLFPYDRHKEIWIAIGRRIGVKHMPKIGISGCGSFRVLTLGQAAEYLAHECPRHIKGAKEGWSRAEIADVVHWHMCHSFGLRRDQYTEDSRFVEDLGLS